MEDPFCYFYRNTGKIVYRNRNIIRDVPDSNLNRQNCEMVHSKNIYTDGNSYYYLTELYTESLSPVKNSPKENLDTTAFTISIDANKGTTTGISAQDRSTTAKLVILTSPYIKLAINLFYRINNLRVKPIVTFFYFYFYRH